MIYLDHNATTPLRPRVRDAMRPWLEDRFGNPSSAHAQGQRARAVIDEARATVAGQIDCEPGEVVFTGGGTEADLLALVGTVLAAGDPDRGRVVISAIEHEAVLHAADLLSALGCEVVRVPPAISGRVEPDVFLDACRAGTTIASLMLASNETGVVQLVEEIAPELRRRNIPFHTDAVQAFGKLPLGFAALGVDLLSISAHKLGGPKGTGALIVRRGRRLTPLQGGSQEAGRRGGTHNVAGIVGLAAATREIDTRLAAMREAGVLRDRLESELADRLPDVHVHGIGAPRVPNTSSLAFGGVDAAALLTHLDLADICVSRGSACASGAEEPSHVLAAMQVPDVLALGTLRISLGVETSAAEITRTIAAVVEGVERQRAGAAPAASR